MCIRDSVTTKLSADDKFLIIPSSAEAGTVVATYDDDSLVNESSFQYDPELVQTNPEGLQFIKEDGKVVLGIKTGVTLTPSETEIFFDGQPHGFDGTIKVTDSHGSVITQTLSDVTLTYSDEEDGVYTDAVPVDAGTHWVKATSVSYTHLQCFYSIIHHFLTIFQIY